MPVTHRFTEEALDKYLEAKGMLGALVSLHEQAQHERHIKETTGVDGVALKRYNEKLSEFVTIANNARRMSIPQSLIAQLVTSLPQGIQQDLDDLLPDDTAA